MDEAELEQTMLAFLRGEADCLVATTIIESGLDIPQANTLIVERADELGLAQAYQIRGRVGRSRERAYAYLLYPSEEALSSEAAARLATLSDHTELGSGFAIAMRDLELRGAGDLLGEEQSGHVAAVGFELYVSLLDDAVQELRAADGTGAAEAQVRLRRRRRRLPARRLHPLRGGEDRRAPPRWRAPASRASCAPCATSSATVSARCPSRSRACSSCSAPGSSWAASAPARSSSAASGCRSPRSSWTPPRWAACGSGSRRRCTSRASRPLSVRVPDQPEARLAAVLDLAEAVAGASAEPVQALNLRVRLEP